MSEANYWRIVGYSVDNFMRLKHVEFTPTGRMTVFTGKNGQGKTSALDALLFVLAGKKWSPEMPMRRGATHLKAQLKLENGEKAAFTVTRTASGLKIEMAPGCKAWDTPQAMLDSITHELMLDPLEFVRLGKDAEGKRRQVEILKGAITLDVDLNDLAQKNRDDFEKRREVNREIDRLKAEIASIPVQPGLPDQPIDLAEIHQRINQANEHNRGIVQLIQRRQQLSNELATAEANEKRNAELIASTNAAIERLTADLEAIAPAGKGAAAIRDGLEELMEKARALPEIQGLAAQIREAITESRARALRYIPAAGTKQSQAGDELDAARKTLKAAERQTEALSQAVATAQVALEQAPQPAMQDLTPLTDELAQAQTVNREIEKRDRQNALKKQLEAKETESRAYTRAMEDRDEQKRKAVAAAKMPIEGLSFSDNEIMFDAGQGPVPIAQLGEAQQLRISISVALARKPQLRIVRIPNGEALDDDSMDALADMAEEMDFYIWMAKVDTSGTLGIFLEDGEVKAVNEKPPKKRKGDPA